MVDPANREKINRLRSRIQDLRNAPDIGKPLYLEGCTLLAGIYGIQSKELHDFQSIRFEIEDPILSAEEALKQSFPSVAPTISLENYYRGRLSEADEYLVTLLLCQ